MRTLIINMLAAALLLFGASSASAFSINHTTNYDGVTELVVSDTITVNVFIDTQGAGGRVGAGGIGGDTGGAGLAALSVGVIFESPFLEYVPGTVSSPGCLPVTVAAGGYRPNGTAPCFYGNYYLGGQPLGNPYGYLNNYLNGIYLYPVYGSPTYQTPDNGTQSSYIMLGLSYGPTGAFPGQPGGYMVPSATPWDTWPAPATGEEQVNLIWVPYAVEGMIPNFAQQSRASTNTWIGSLVLHVRAQGPDQVLAGLKIDSTELSVLTGDGVQHRAATTLDAPTTINLPEPTIALLLGFGLLGLGLAGRRQD